MLRLFIEGFEADVNQNFTHQITLSVDDISKIDTKTTSFSKTIVLPGTSNNNRLLGNIFQFSNSNFTNDADKNVYYNFNAARSAKARIEINGLQVIKGVLRLLEIIIDGDYVEYEVAIFGELGGFVANMGAKKITGNFDSGDDLDFSEYNHTYNITNILSSWSTGNNIAINAGSFFNMTIGSTTYHNLQIPYLENRFKVGDVITISGTTSNNTTYTISAVNYMTVWTTTTTLSFTTSVTTETINIPFSASIGSSYFSNGYKYPLIDYGNCSYDISGISTAKKDYQYTAFRPALFVKEYMQKIISKAGYTYESNFFETDIFSRLVVPNNQKVLKVNRDNIYQAGFRYNDVTTNADLYVDSNYLGLMTTTDNISYKYVSAQTFDGYLNVKFSGSCTIIDPPGGTANGQIFAVLKVYKNGSVYYYDLTQQFGGGITSLYYGRQYSVNYNLPITLINNDEIKFALEIVSQTSGAYFSHNYIDPGSIRLDAKFPILSPIIYGDSLNMNDTLPLNILQKDFFVSVLKMFNLMVTEDRVKEKHLIIEPWVDFYDLDRTTYLDWSQKVDRSKVIKIKPMAELTARYYQFKYKADTDFYNDKYRKEYSEGYGDRLFDNQFEFAKETESVEVLFSATPLVGYTGRDKVVSTILKLTNNVEETTESNLRILQLKLITGISSWKILNNKTTLATRTDYLYAGHLDNPDVPAADLNFGATKQLYFDLVSGALSNNIFNAYYSPYMAEITDKDSRIVTVYMKLTEKDIYNIDFGRFIWIDGVLYRLIKIYDYAENEICQVDLLRVIYTTY